MNLLRLSTPKYAFIPKYRWCPFFVWYITGSRAFLAFLVEDGALIIVASTIAFLAHLPHYEGAGQGRTSDRVIKRVFGFAKVRYRGLGKNAHRRRVVCTLANLFIARRHLLRCDVA